MQTFHAAAADEASRLNLLFVYGTLRPTLIDLALAEAPKGIMQRQPHHGLATVPGILIDLGAYPGFVRHRTGSASAREPAAARVVGELVEVTAEQLVVLDAYEECEGSCPLYRRERIQATRQRDNLSIDCWIYVYSRDISAAGFIASGDYARHVGR